MPMRIYRAPNGMTYQYREGEQPEGFVEVKSAPRPRNKARSASTKTRRAKAGDA